MRRDLTGYKIREQRKHLGITQAHLAQSVGISPSYLNLIEANKRPIAGKLLNDIARGLTLDPETLNGKSEQRLIDDLQHLAADPILGDFALDSPSINDLVGRSKNWARATLALYRVYLDQTRAVAALSDRLNQDPFLGDAVHQMLSQVTAVRSTSDILATFSDLKPAEVDRFHAILASESGKLSDVAQGLADFFDSERAKTQSATPIQEVDDFIIERGNYFANLETAAADFREELKSHGETLEGALVEYLNRRHGINVRSIAPGQADATRLRNQSMYLAETSEFLLLDNSAVSTRRFQLARLAFELGNGDLLSAETQDDNLSSADARQRAIAALSSYGAGALLFPYDEFLQDALDTRYDIEILRQRYVGSFEQIGHRLVTLRKTGAAGIPFAFMRVNPAGHATKRFPLPGLLLPRDGRACPLWAIYGTFQTPGRVIRRLARFPNGARFLFIARTVTKRPATFHEPQFLYSVMLACDVVHADQTVYGDGLSFDAAASADPVGPSCRLCPRRDCQQREEAAIVAPEEPEPASINIEGQ